MDVSELRSTIRVQFKYCIYKSDDFCVCQYKNIDTDKRVVCTSKDLPQKMKITYIFTGYEKETAKYGKNFVVEDITPELSDKESLYLYLCSGEIKGLGKKKAKQLVDTFGLDVLNVLENEPEKIAEIKGFTIKKACQLSEQIKLQKGSSTIVRYLLAYGISRKIALSVYKFYTNGISVDDIKVNPYLLCRFRGVTFEKADFIASCENIPLDDDNRIKCGIYEVLKNAESFGHTALEWTGFYVTLKTLLGMTLKDEVIKNVVQDMAINGKIILKKLDSTRHFIYTKRSWDREHHIYEDLIRINQKTRTISGTEKDILAFEKEKGIVLDTLQKEAIIFALESNESLSVITGGPGTGKTTIINIIADIYKKRYSDNIVFLAPTGRAAKRMSETSGKEAKTIHSYLNIRPETVSNNTDVEISNSLVIIDEFSMVDVNVAETLFSAIKKNCRVIIVGDDNQLPSVGAGAVLRDILFSKLFHVTCLNKIFRQKDSEKIVENAKRINDGNGELENGSDFCIYEESDMQKAKKILLDLYIKRIDEYGIENVMLLCPYKKYDAGVWDLNKSIQEIVNPYKENKKELKYGDCTYRVGDYVMHLKNTTTISNGDLGFIVNIDTEDETITAEYTNINGRSEQIVYEKDDFDSIIHAYAMTVHKSQGSEAQAVICYFSKFHKAMLYRNLPYVAISRGKKYVDLVGEKEALKIAAKTAAQNKRITLLALMLKKHKEQGDSVKWEIK